MQGRDGAQHLVVGLHGAVVLGVGLHGAPVLVVGHQAAGPLEDWPEALGSACQDGGVDGVPWALGQHVAEAWVQNWDEGDGSVVVAGPGGPWDQDQVWAERHVHWKGGVQTLLPWGPLDVHWPEVGAHGEANLARAGGMGKAQGAWVCMLQGEGSAPEVLEVPEGAGAHEVQALEQVLGLPDLESL